MVADIQERVAEQLDLPAGYCLEYAGQFEAAGDATRTIGLLSLVSLAAVFLLLFAQFRSMRQALLIMVNLPLALAAESSPWCSQAACSTSPRWSASSLFSESPYGTGFCWCRTTTT